MSVHIYTTSAQPYTRWRFGEEIMSPPSPWFRNHPRKQEWCQSCYRTRWAKNMSVYAYYDQVRIVCKGGCAPSNYRERYNRRRRLQRATVNGTASL